VDNLILIPTSIESRKILSAIPEIADVAHVALCGFGPILAAARAGILLATQRPKRCLLIGIAGTYNSAVCPLGSAFAFESVGCFGIGSSNEKDFLLPSQMGFPMWQDENQTINEQLTLYTKPFGNADLQLLTVCAASSNAHEVQTRKKHFPFAVAEDMEGFAIAAACSLSQVPFSIIRGISNRAGDRDRKNWEIDNALSAAVPLIHSWLTG
jgi:futalosine hydrolase